MGTLDEIKNIPKEFQFHRDELVKLFKDHNIKSIAGLISCYRTNNNFKNEWNRVWYDLVKANGGKLSLTTVGIIIGSALGGVGIAAMGSAIGMPLALLLGLSGFVLGNKIDDKSISIKLSDDLLAKLEQDARYTKTTVSELIELLIQQTYSNLNPSIGAQIINNEADEIDSIESTVSFWTNQEFSDDFLSTDGPPLDDEDIPAEAIDCYQYGEDIDELYETISSLESTIEDLKDHISFLEYKLGVIAEEADQCS